ncbi:30S ribosomal protein S6 [Spiroplasma sp. AdecLV25b]|uniref:30S ribosomal protein S6 n=1 Tax=Spiroplasma sp. AdecLV25b TaxID=3027162 RepID=UPI0027E1E0C4|nr:30S ribosomal protein S6 [Spiroplasma sp. AdecLV25b]
MEDLNKKHNYEIMYIVDDQNQEKAQLIKKELIAILIENGGEIKKEEDAIRTFAYDINKKVKGHYFIIEVSTSPKNIANFNRVVLIKQKQLEVIRFLVINLDSEKINKFKVKRQVEPNNYVRTARPGNRERTPYNREGDTERKPRPIAGTESASHHRPRSNYVPKTNSAPSTIKKD